MALCNLTQKILSNQCIGDSLRTINSNFSALDIGICSIPDIIEGEGFDIDLQLNPLGTRTYLELSPTRFPVFKKDFDTTQNITLTSIFLSDGTSIRGYNFPYVNTIDLTDKPIATFTEISEQFGVPKLTLFWTASSSDTLSTVYSLNSAYSLDAQPPTEPDNEVLCFYREQDTLYVGGSFEKVGGSAKYKLLAISLSSGNNVGPIYGKTGAVDDTQIPTLFPILDKGSIKCMSKIEVQTNEGLRKLFIVGGDFISDTAGRGLFVYDETVNTVRAFYFNGEVEEILLDPDDKALYAVGQFDWVNLGANPSSELSNDRVYCNNMIKLKLDYIASINAIDLDFVANSSQALQSSVKLNTISRYGNLLFVGGDVQIVSEAGRILHKNLLCLRRSSDKESQKEKGTLISELKFIFDKPIYTSLIDNQTLYLGGQFTIAASYDNFYNLNLENRKNKITFFHAACMNLSNPVLPSINNIWKPRFNDIVYKFEVPDDSYDSEIYALGAFTEVNYKSTSYIAAITKATTLLGSAPAGLQVTWNVALNSGPTKKTNGLLRYLNKSVFIGGKFTKVNDNVRKYYTKVLGAGESVSETTPKVVEFEFGGQILNQGHEITFDFETVESTTQAVGSAPFGIVNRTVFEPLTQSFQGMRSNQLCRFYLKRNCSNDLLFENAYILGWSLVYEKP